MVYSLPLCGCASQRPLRYDDCDMLTNQLEGLQEVEHLGEPPQLAERKHRGRCIARVTLDLMLRLGLHHAESGLSERPNPTLLQSAHRNVKACCELSNLITTVIIKY